jgi:hypothetical protein
MYAQQPKLLTLGFSDLHWCMLCRLRNGALDHLRLSSVADADPSSKSGLQKK